MGTELPNPAGKSRSHSSRQITTVEGATPFVPETPTTGAEAAELWGMNQADAQSVMLKVLRQPEGQRTFELLDTMPLLRWEMVDTAGKFGPGVYIIKPGGGAFKAKQFTLRVSDEFARQSGFARVEPMPSAIQQMGMGITQRIAEQAGVQPLMVALETMMKPIMERMEKLERGSGAPSFGFQEFMQLQMMMEDRSSKKLFETMELISKIQGGKPIKSDEEEEGMGGSMANLGKGLGEGIGAALLGLLTKKQETKTVESAAVAPGVQMKPEMPEGWTAAELSQCQTLVDALKMSVPRLNASKAFANEETVADGLLEVIQDDAVPAVLKLAEVSKRTDGAALGVIDPSFARNKYWMKVIELVAEGVAAEDKVE